MRIPTSVVLDRLLRAAPADQVTLAWIVAQLRERSFGIVILLIALISLMPGASLFAGILLTLPAMQMMLARPAPVLPRRIMQRRVPTPRLTRLARRLAPVLRRLERVVKPRWRTPFEATKRTIGGVILLMGMSIASPVPFSHIIPILVTMLIAFAYIEEDGALLCIGLAAAVASLAISAAVIWGTVEAGLLL